MRQAWIMLGLSAAALAAAGSAGCSVHRSSVETWYFHDRQTGDPINTVLLLDWTERTQSRSPEAVAFEQRVPGRENLASVRAVQISRAQPAFHPATRGNIQAYAMSWNERSRYMACCPGYNCRVNFASEEELAKLNVESSDGSVVYIMLSSVAEPTDAVDWLSWLTSGRAVLRDKLAAPQRRAVYDALTAYWEKVAAARPAELAAELAGRTAQPAEGNLTGELARIYREEIGRAAPKLSR